MLKKTGNKTEGYTITQVTGKGAKKVSKTLSATINGQSLIMEFSTATTLSSNAVYVIYNGVELLIVDDDQGNCKLFSNVFYLKDDLSRKAWYFGFDTNTSRPIVLMSDSGNTYKQQQVTVHLKKYICTTDLVIWQEGESFKAIPIHIKRLRVIDDTLVIRGSYNTLYGTWIIENTDRMFYSTAAIDSIIKLHKIGNTFAIEMESGKYVMQNTEQGMTGVIDTTLIPYTDSLSIKSYQINNGASFDAVTFCNNGINYVLIGSTRLIQAGIIFKLAGEHFVFEEKSLELLKVSAELAEESNMELSKKYELETSSPSVKLIKGDLPEKTKLDVDGKTTHKGHILQKSVFEPAANDSSEEILNITTILQGDVNKELTFSTVCTSKETLLIMRSNTKFCTKDNEIKEKASGVRRFGNFLVLHDFLGSPSVIITLDKVSFLRGSTLRFLLPTDNFDLGLLGELFCIESGNCKITGEYIKFTTKGIALYNKTCNKASVISYDGCSITPLDIKGFADLNYYALFDVDDWKNYYYSSLPIKELVKMDNMDIF